MNISVSASALLTRAGEQVHINVSCTYFIKLKMKPLLAWGFTGDLVKYLTVRHFTVSGDLLPFTAMESSKRAALSLWNYVVS